MLTRWATMSCSSRAIRRRSSLGGGLRARLRAPEAHAPHELGCARTNQAPVNSSAGAVRSVTSGPPCARRRGRRRRARSPRPITARSPGAWAPHEYMRQHAGRQQEGDGRQLAGEREPAKPAIAPTSEPSGRLRRHASAIAITRRQSAATSGRRPAVSGLSQSRPARARAARPRPSRRAWRVSAQRCTGRPYARIGWIASYRGTIPDPTVARRRRAAAMRPSSPHPDRPRRSTMTDMTIATRAARERRGPGAARAGALGRPRGRGGAARRRVLDRRRDPDPHGRHERGRRSPRAGC